MLVDVELRSFAVLTAYDDDDGGPALRTPNSFNHLCVCTECRYVLPGVLPFIFRTPLAQLAQLNSIKLCYKFESKLHSKMVVKNLLSLS